MKQYALVTLLMFAIPTSAASQRPGEPPAEPNSATPSFDPVTQERLLNADAEPENCLM